MNLNVVLVEPEIPQNTGNIGRLCLATQAHLHLIEPLGFELSHSRLKRAGLDYWQHLQVSQYVNFEVFWNALPKDIQTSELFFFSKKTKKSFYEASFQKRSYFFFGKETKGLPEPLLEKYQDQSFRIPIFDERVRSLNLANAVGIVLYEAIRQFSVS